MTKKIFLYYLPRALSVVIVGFFAMFILEGFSPEFSWVDSLMHLLLTLVILGITIVAWKWPKIGGWIFLFFGLFWLFEIRHDLEMLFMPAVPLMTGILFLAGSYAKKK